MAEEYLEAKDLVSKIEYTTPGFISNPGDRVIKPIERPDQDFFVPVEPRKPIDDNIRFEPIVGRLEPINGKPVEPIIGKPIQPIIGKPIQPITGSPGPGIFGLMLSLSDIEEMIPKLRQASTDLKDVWSKTINSTVAKIENSWAGEDARVYTDKVQALDPRVDKVCQAIDLLAQTYQKVLDRSRTTVSEVSQKISSISIN